MYALRHRGQYPQAVASELDSFLSALRAWLAVDHNEDGTHHVPVLPEPIPLGGIVMWGTNTAPSLWLLCDGSAVSRTVYQGLFNVIGTTYGAGDSSTTFNVPDMRQRFPMGKAGSGTGATLGSTGGSIDHAHSFSGGTTGSNGGFSTSTGSGGAHSHAVSGTAAASGGGVAAVSNPSPTWFGSQDDHTHSVSGSTDSASDHTHSISVGDHTHSFGGGNTDTDNPPYLVMQFIIFAGV